MKNSPLVSLNDDQFISSLTVVRAVGIILKNLFFKLKDKFNE